MEKDGNSTEYKELKESLSSRARAAEAERETFFEIFFFKNFQNPDYEVERFCANYEASGWIRKNGHQTFCIFLKFFRNFHFCHMLTEIADCEKLLSLKSSGICKNLMIAELQGKKEQGKNVLLRADIDALPLEEKVESDYKSRYDGCMHACGHDGHATWLIGAAKILAQLTDEFGGCIRFAFQPGEEVGLGADTMIEEDKVLEDPKMDMAFAAHGWPSVESGKIGIVRRYAFGCVGDFKVRIIGKKGHASWPEQTVDPIAAANEIYQHIPAILTRTVSGTEPKIMSVTYMQAGDVNVRNIIPQDCVFGGTMRAVKREVLEKMKAELEKEIKGICQVSTRKPRQISGFMVEV